MNGTILFFAFWLGLIIGSFLNVVILRINTGFSLSGRSFCFSCGKKLRFTELIPLLSFLIQRGRCRGCQSSISWQYPLVELAAGIAFLSAIWQFQTRYIESVFSLVLYLASFSILIAIAVYDLKHKIIPDVFAYAFIAFSLVLSVFRVYDAPGVLPVIDLLAGPLLFLFFFSFWYFSDGKWMGFGDAKLALGIGLMLGLPYGVSAIIVGFWTGALWSMAAMLIQKTRGRRGRRALSLKSEVPFAPFLIFGTFMAFLLHLDLFSLSAVLSLVFGN